MIKTCVISVGKIKEKETKNLIEEYEKRLSKYTDFKTIEVQDLSLPDNPREGDIEKVLLKEGQTILNKLPEHMVKIALCIEAKQYSSEEFASLIEKSSINGGVCFVIGSSHGLHNDVIKRCDDKISLSKMTFPHNLAKLILTEQIYRGFKILKSERYHK